MATKTRPTLDEFFAMPGTEPRCGYWRRPTFVWPKLVSSYTFPMGGDRFIERITTSAGATAALGERVGRELRKGDIVLLSGDLGTGKTCFTQGVGRGLSCDETVNSPSFVLMNEYHGRETLYHVDLYRIEDVEELDELGLWDYAESGVLIIEWPERGIDLLPGDGLVVEFAFGEHEEERRLRLHPRGPRGEAILAAIAS
ncbi:MAG: hypothetical protein Kow0010_19940 [Dehalococcoidia bacterium]